MSIIPTLRYDDPKAAIHFLVTALGFTEKNVMTADDQAAAAAHSDAPTPMLVELDLLRSLTLDVHRSWVVDRDRADVLSSLLSDPAGHPA